MEPSIMPAYTETSQCPYSTRWASRIWGGKESSGICTAMHIEDDIHLMEKGKDRIGMSMAGDPAERWHQTRRAAD